MRVLVNFKCCQKLLGKDASMSWDWEPCLLRFLLSPYFIDAICNLGFILELSGEGSLLLLRMYKCHRISFPPITERRWIIYKIILFFFFLHPSEIWGHKAAKCNTESDMPSHSQAWVPHCCKLISWESLKLGIRPAFYRLVYTPTAKSNHVRTQPLMKLKDNVFTLLTSAFHWLTVYKAENIEIIMQFMITEVLSFMTVGVEHTSRSRAKRDIQEVGCFVLLVTMGKPIL